MFFDISREIICVLKDVFSHRVTEYTESSPVALHIFSVLSVSLWQNHGNSQRTYIPSIHAGFLGTVHREAAEILLVHVLSNGGTFLLTNRAQPMITRTTCAPAACRDMIPASTMIARLRHLTVLDVLQTLLNRFAPLLQDTTMIYQRRKNLTTGKRDGVLPGNCLWNASELILPQ